MKLYSYVDSVEGSKPKLFRKIAGETTELVLIFSKGRIHNFEFFPL